MPRADKAAFIQGMLSEHQLRQQREATKPVPDSMEWWRDVAQGLGVELATLRATIAEQAATIAALQTAMYSGDEAGVTCACRWEHLPGGAGASGPQIRECGEHHGLRMRVEEQAATIARLEGERDGWERTAADMANGMAFYRDIVRQAGQHFGPAVYTSDDGSVQDEVLALKVPELAAAVVAERDEAVQEFEVMNARLGEVIIAKAQAEAERDALRARVAAVEAVLDDEDGCPECGCPACVVRCRVYRALKEQP
jgi:hypothetical protein